MKIIIGESGWSMIERLAYRGAIGIFFRDTLSGVLAYALFGLICLFATIGVIATIKFIISRLLKKGKKQEDDPYTRWLHSGKI